MVEQLFKDAEFTPSGEAFINRVPVTILLGQESPLRSRTSDPQDSLEETTYITSGSESYLWTSFQHGQYLVPLVISQLNFHPVE